MKNKLQHIFPGPVLKYKIEKIVWLVMIPVVVFTKLGESVTFVSFVSVYALFLTSAGAQKAAEAAVNNA